jgi:hypothetical protein
MERFYQFLLCILLLVLLLVPDARAGKRYVVAGGNWNQTSIWSAAPDGTPGAAVPTSNDTVYLANGKSDFFYPTIPAAHNAVCHRLEFGSSATSIGSALMFASSGSTLTINGDLIIYGPNSTANRLIYVNGGRLTVMGNVELGTGQTGNQDDRICRLTISTGTITIEGNLLFNNVAGSSPLQTRIDMRGGAATINLGGAFIINNGSGMVNGGSESLFNFTGTSPQTIPVNVGAVAFNTLVINNTSSGGALLGGAVTTATVTGSLIVQSGTLNNGGFPIQGNSGVDFEIADNATFRMTGTTGMVTGFATKTFGATSTVEYAGTNQTVSNESYGSLVLSGSGTKTMPGTAMTIAGNLSVLGSSSAAASAGLTINGNFMIGPGATFDAGAFTHTVSGNWTNSGTFAQGTSTFVLGGTSTQSMTGPTSFNNLIINNAAGVSLQSDITVSNTLTLGSGNVATGPNTLTLGTSPLSLGTLSRNSGTIIGNLKRWCAASTSTDVLFPVGTSSNYRPANLSFTAAPSGGGTLTASFVASAPGTTGLPVLDGVTQIMTCSGNGFWTLVAGNGLTGGTYSLDLTADGFLNVSDFSTLRILRRANASSAWIVSGTHIAGTGSNASPVVHRVGLSGFSEFGIGSGSDNPLPIELHRFTATAVVHGGVRLDWATLTETNNYGFEVQKSERSTEGFQTIPNSLVLGHGTTLSPQSYTYTDAGAAAGTWYYRLRQIDLDGASHFTSPIGVDVAADVREEPIPTKFALHQNYPNPFNPTTRITFGVSENGFVSLKVVDVLGREIATLINEELEPGSYTAVFDAHELTSGVYIYTLKAGKFHESRKLLLVR